jgi:hypothetical protein
MEARIKQLIDCHLRVRRMESWIISNKKMRKMDQVQINHTTPDKR